MSKSMTALPIALATLALGACGSSSNLTVSAPKVAAAKVFTLAGFQPAGQVMAGDPVTISFTVQLPSGKPLTRYKTRSGPHTGVHLIIVRDDLAYIIHEHPPIGPNGLLRQTVTFPAPVAVPRARRHLSERRRRAAELPAVPERRRRRALPGAVAACVQRRPGRRRLPPDQVVDGYHPTRSSTATTSRCRDIRNCTRSRRRSTHVDVTDPAGHSVTFVPWFGALAHAIFFHQGSLDYFHTHICAPNAPNCGTLPGVTATRITGSSAAPGKLTIGVLLPVPGTWRLFLQMKLAGHVVTAPYTLKVGR